MAPIIEVKMWHAGKEFIDASGDRDFSPCEAQITSSESTWTGGSLYLL
jgi:hypothetical protein